MKAVEVHEGSANSVNLGAEKNIDFAFLDVLEQPLVLGSIDVLSGLAFFAVNLSHHPFLIPLGRLHLSVLFQDPKLSV